MDARVREPTLEAEDLPSAIRKHRVLERSRNEFSIKLERETPRRFKTVRLVEGATVREFAEALGITPRDIVQLLIKRGVFATLNQPIAEKMAIEMGMDFGFDLSFVPFEEMVIEAGV